MKDFKCMFSLKDNRIRYQTKWVPFNTLNVSLPRAIFPLLPFIFIFGSILGANNLKKKVSDNDIINGINA